MDKSLFFKSAAKTIVPVTVDGQTFHVKRLSLTEQVVFEAMVSSQGKNKKNEHNFATVLISCVCDEHGTLLLSHDDYEHIKTIDSQIALALYTAALTRTETSEDNEEDEDHIKKVAEQSDTPVYL